jgi:hypothetical protein
MSISLQRGIGNFSGLGVLMQSTYDKRFFPGDLFKKTLFGLIGQWQPAGGLGNPVARNIM